MSKWKWSPGWKSQENILKGNNNWDYAENKSRELPTEGDKRKRNYLGGEGEKMELTCANGTVPAVLILWRKNMWAIWKELNPGKRTESSTYVR